MNIKQHNPKEGDVKEIRMRFAPRRSRATRTDLYSGAGHAPWGSTPVAGMVPAGDSL